MAIATAAKIESIAKATSVSSTLITVAQKPLCFLGSAISSVSLPCFLLSKNSLICAPAIYSKYNPPKT